MRQKMPAHSVVTGKGSRCKARTDLACEMIHRESGAGVVRREEIGRGEGKFVIEETVIHTDEAAERLGKPRGRYITLSFPCRISELEPREAALAVKLTADELRALAGDYFRRGKERCVEIVGLGNREMTADSLGVRTAELIRPTREPGGEKGTFVFIPGVGASTGMSSSESVYALTKSVGAELAVIIDSLAARSYERLGSTVQLSDTGIRPGSGLGRRKNTLDSETLGIRVISVGVPTVISSTTLVSEVLEAAVGSEVGELPREIAGMLRAGEYFLVSPADCDTVVSNAALILSRAIENAFSIGNNNSVQTRI